MILSKCSIKSAGRLPLIVVEEKGDDWQALLEGLSDRASHTVSRQIDRSRAKKGRKSMAGDQELYEELLAIEASSRSDQEWNPLRDRPERRK